MKKLINDPRHLVRELLEGTVDLAPHLALLEAENVVLRADLPEPAARKVAVISGGGSGHEPAHAGYVGRGMLTAAVAGDVFTSPSTDAVLAAILAASGPAGALLVVKNYTGDRLNFGLAAELARREGIPVEMIVVADDVSLTGLVERERRRGIAGTVLVHKLAGAAAERRMPLGQVAQIARDAASRVGSMGVALGACTVPSAGKPGFTLGDNEIEFGLGIHGEQGVERTVLKTADAIVAELLDRIVADLDASPAVPIALLVNGLGATPPMELAVVARAALANLRGRGFTVKRAWCGSFMTAIEMPGVSLSLLPLTPDDGDLFDDPTEASAWPGDGRISSERRSVAAPPPAEPEPAAQGPLSETMRAASFAVADALEAAEDGLADLDARAGDGDLGASMARAAAAMRALPAHSFANPSRLLSDLGNALRRAIGGSSGPFYATALLRAAATLEGKAEPASEDWRAALDAGTHAIVELGGAKPGDRTMVDALVAAVAAWKKSGSFADAAAGAETGAKATAGMHPALGRAAYLGKRAVGIEDGGAVAVAIWLRALVNAGADWRHAGNRPGS